MIKRSDKKKATIGYSFYLFFITLHELSNETLLEGSDNSPDAPLFIF